MIKLIAFDLDGTLTQHKTKLEPKNVALLDELSRSYRLLMVGAGACMRIFNQMDHYPLDIIGNYGLQYGQYNARTGELDPVRDEVFDIDRPAVEKRIAFLRQKHGFTAYAGDSVEYHASGCVTFPILGTKALQADKLAFDPDRSRRRSFYDEVCELFPEYRVFVGGSSSFDMSPRPYDKYYALSLYCREHGYSHDEVLYVGDDYGRGGNDEAVFLSDIRCVPTDDYRTTADVLRQYLNTIKE